MKFMHLSDLHVGKSVNGFSMIAEQEYVFGQIIGYIRAERPAAVIIAGDVYDRAVPSVEAVLAFDNFLTALAGEGVAVMLIAGNHDSPERLHYASRLLADKNLFFYGVFNKSDGIKKITLPDEYGAVNFWLLPFIKPSSVRGAFEGRDVESHADAVAAAIEAAEVDYASRNVLVSHQFYTKAGVAPLLSESELAPVGGLDAVDAGVIEQFDYAALGHLHREQCAGAKHIRYCGSPVKYSFSEREHKKSVTIVELGEKGNLAVSTLPLTPIHDMRVIKGPIKELLSDKASAAADREDYLHAVLTDNDELLFPMDQLRSAYPNIMSLDYENSRTGINPGAITADAEAIQNTSFYDLFSQFFLETQASVMSGQQAEIVRRLLETEGEE